MNKEILNAANIVTSFRLIGAQMRTAVRRFFLCNDTTSIVHTA